MSLTEAAGPDGQEEEPLAAHAGTEQHAQNSERDPMAPQWGLHPMGTRSLPDIWFPRGVLEIESFSTSADGTSYRKRTTTGTLEVDGQGLLRRRRNKAFGCVAIVVAVLASVLSVVLVRLGSRAASEGELASDRPILELRVEQQLIKYGLSTRGASAFRVRLKPDATPVDTPMVDPSEEDSRWTMLTGGGDSAHGIATQLGSVVIKEHEVLQLHRPDGHLITTATVPAMSQTAMKVQFKKSWNAKVYGGGGGPTFSNSMLMAKGDRGKAFIGHEYSRGSASHVPYYYSTDGYAVLGVVSDSCFQYGEQRDSGGLGIMFQVNWDHIEWKADCEALEFYLMPASSLEEATLAFYSLTGRPQVPPMWAFGYFASQEFWNYRKGLERTLSIFRLHGFPADGVVLGTTWRSLCQDYDVQGVPFPENGIAKCQDFGWLGDSFPKPRHQLGKYKQFGFRIGGLLHPRLTNDANLAEASGKGYLLPKNDRGSVGDGRILDFSKEVVRQWYASKHKEVLQDGLRFFQNSEAEQQYYQYLWFNVAELEAFRLAEKQEALEKGTPYKPQRFFSINRAFTPGLARFGGAVWTGEVTSTWSALSRQPRAMLHWTLAGNPYVSSDIGGFAGDARHGNGEGEVTGHLLTRWYQMSVFMPLMRVQSMEGHTAHFPFMYAKDLGAAMQLAMYFRYRLVPYHYSMAHAMFWGKRLWIRPMAIAFPDFKATDALTMQWMDGEILVAPVTSEDDAKRVVLPRGTWYPFFEDSTATAMPTRSPTRDLVVQGTAELTEIPAYVRHGSIIVLAPRVNHTDQLPGDHPLEVRIYTGADASFTLYEDDGDSIAYVTENEVRETAFTWQEAERRISWQSTGSSPRTYRSLDLIVYGLNGTRLWKTGERFEDAGSVEVAGLDTTDSA